MTSNDDSNPYLGKVGDNYGFELESDEQRDALTSVSDLIEYKQEQQRNRWKPLMEKLETIDHALLKKHARKGIPSEYRGHVWYVLSGANKQHAKCENLYQRFAQLAKDSIESGNAPDALIYVDKDIDRTYPEHPLFRGGDSLKEKLRNVLYAFAMRNPDIGYCQSMNFMAGIVLFHIADEEKAFWCFERLMNSIVPGAIYESGMDGLFIQVHVLKKLLKARRPKLFNHLEKIDADIALFTSSWFLAIYTITFPPETALRVWDALFSEGYKIVFRVGLAFFQLHEQRLLKCKDVGEVMTMIQSMSSQMFDCRKLMKAAFAIRRFSWEDVLKHRASFVPQK